MQRIVIENTTPIEVKKAWSLLTDINNYPKYVKFVLKIKDAPSDFQEGVCWTDITNIVWIPLAIKHKIIKIERYKKIVYKLFLPFGGTMLEECDLTAGRQGTKISTKIEFTFGNYFLDLVFGAILKIRLKEMLSGTFRNLLFSSKANHNLVYL